eukprot:m.1520909 g.1520909  ORF g.1520909 m.1520909 type:complete len:450 (+) comp25228_c0_seq25:176-1525(+)
MFGGDRRAEKASVADRAKQARAERAAQRQAKEKNAVAAKKLELVKRVLRRKVAQLKIALSLRSKFDTATAAPTIVPTHQPEKTSDEPNESVQEDVAAGAANTNKNRILLDGQMLQGTSSTDTATEKNSSSAGPAQENNGFPVLTGEQIVKCTAWLLFAASIAPELSAFSAGKSDHTRTVRLARIILNSLDAVKNGGDYAATVSRSYASQALIPKRMAAWMSQVKALLLVFVDTMLAEATSASPKGANLSTVLSVIWRLLDADGWGLSPGDTPEASLRRKALVALCANVRKHVDGAGRLLHRLHDLLFALAVNTQTAVQSTARASVLSPALLDGIVTLALQPTRQQQQKGAGDWFCVTQTLFTVPSLITLAKTKSKTLCALLERERIGWHCVPWCLVQPHDAERCYRQAVLCARLVFHVTCEPCIAFLVVVSLIDGSTARATWCHVFVSR